MIVCHCQAITDHDIRAAVDWMRAADPDTLITPGKIYRALGKRADCGGCMPLFLDTMRTNGNFRVPGFQKPGVQMQGEQMQGEQMQGAAAVPAPHRRKAAAAK